MVCKHDWKPVSVDGIGVFNIRAMGMFVCSKCMSYKEHELKFVNSEDSD